MQVAARRVAWENTQLRDLLARNGVSSEEIEGCLRSRGRVEARVSSNTVVRLEQERDPVTQVHEDSPVEALQRIARPTDRIPRETWALEMGAAEQVGRGSTREFEGQVSPEAPVGELSKEVLQQSPLAQDGCGWDASNQPSVGDVEENDLLPTFSECFYPGLPRSSSSTEDDAMLVMSCETAASIISGMLGSGDREQARSQLGCVGHEHCNVKNMKVLQVMEMA
jgi:hypothetical protein